jgi:predicted aconitase
LINGPGQRALKHLTKSQRAALAVAVIRGEANLRPTLGVVSKALEVSIPYIEAALKLSPEQLRQLCGAASSPFPKRVGAGFTSEADHPRRHHRLVAGRVEGGTCRRREQGGGRSPWHAIEANLG